MSCCYCTKKKRRRRILARHRKHVQRLHVEPQRLTKASPNCKCGGNQPVRLPNCFNCFEKQRGRDAVSIARCKGQMYQKGEGKEKNYLWLNFISQFIITSHLQPQVTSICFIYSLDTEKNRWINVTGGLLGSLWVICCTCVGVKVQNEKLGDILSIQFSTRSQGFST